VNVDVTPTLAGIRIYPVKSLTGLEVAEAEVEPWGVRHDRRWVLLTPEGDVVTAREAPAMLLLGASPLDDGGIVLTSRDGSELHVPAPLDGEPVPAAVTRIDALRRAGAEADAWLSSRLGREVRLAWLDDPARRPVSERHGGLPGDHLALADAGPLLLTSQSSLGRLNEWIVEGAAARGERPPAAIGMIRFRPNLVVGHVDEAFAEDAWLTVRIGAVEMRLGEQCDRCFLTTFDPDTLERGKEPLRTLATHRRREHKTWFGVRLIPVSTGRIRIGDPVTVLARA
jgi:MOSC domain-containing protein